MRGMAAHLETKPDYTDLRAHHLPMSARNKQQSARCALQGLKAHRRRYVLLITD